MKKLILLPLLLLVGCGSSDFVTLKTYAKAVEVCAPHGGVHNLEGIHPSVKFEKDAKDRVIVYCMDGTYIETEYIAIY